MGLVVQGIKKHSVKRPIWEPGANRIRWRLSATGNICLSIAIM